MEFKNVLWICPHSVVVDRFVIFHKRHAAWVKMTITGSNFSLVVVIYTQYPYYTKWMVIMDVNISWYAKKTVNEVETLLLYCSSVVRRGTIDLLVLSPSSGLFWGVGGDGKIKKNATWRWQWAQPVTTILPKPFPDMNFSESVVSHNWLSAKSGGRLASILRKNDMLTWRFFLRV